MGEIVNLRLARKRRQREAGAETAAQNRLRHGRPLHERKRDEMIATRERQRIDAHRREAPDLPGERE